MQQTKDTNTGSRNIGAREVSRVLSRNTNKRSRISLADCPGPKRQSRRIAIREVESNPESSDTIESNDLQSLLTQADIPRIVDAVLNNLPDRDASLLPQNPLQRTDLQELRVFIYICYVIRYIPPPPFPFRP